MRIIPCINSQPLLKGLANMLKILNHNNSCQYI